MNTKFGNVCFVVSDCAVVYAQQHDALRLAKLLLLNPDCPCTVNSFDLCKEEHHVFHQWGFASCQDAFFLFNSVMNNAYATFQIYDGFTYIDSAWIEHHISELCFPSTVCFFIIIVHMLICVCVITFSSFSAACYLYGHINKIRGTEWQLLLHPEDFKSDESHHLCDLSTSAQAPLQHFLPSRFIHLHLLISSVLGSPS